MSALESPNLHLHVYVVGFSRCNYAELFKKIISSDEFVLAARSKDRMWDFRNVEFVNVSDDEGYRNLLCDTDASGLFLVKNQFYTFYDGQGNLLDGQDKEKVLNQNSEMRNSFKKKIEELVNQKRGYVIRWTTSTSNFIDELVPQEPLQINDDCFDYLLEGFLEWNNNDGSNTYYKVVFYQVIAPIIQDLLNGTPRLNSKGESTPAKEKKFRR